MFGPVRIGYGTLHESLVFHRLGGILLLSVMAPPLIVTTPTGVMMRIDKTERQRDSCPDGGSYL
jgi:hypothetical protein